MGDGARYGEGAGDKDCASSLLSLLVLRKRLMLLAQIPRNVECCVGAAQLAGS